MPEQTDPSQTNNGPRKLRAMGFGELLDTAFSLYRVHFWSFLGIAAAYFIAMLVGVSISFFDDWIGKNAKALIWILTIFAIFGVSVFVVSALVFASAQAYLDGKIRTWTVLKQGGRQFFRCCVGVLIFGLLAAILSFLLVSMVSLLLLMLVQNSIRNEFWLAAISLGAGIMAASIIGSFVVYWCFYTLVNFVEGASIRTGLKRSRELIKGERWRIIGTMFAIFLLSIVIAIILRATFAFPLTLTGLSGVGNYFENVRWMVLWELPTKRAELHLSYALMYLINLGIDTFTMPIWVIGCTLLYFDQRIRKEGFDIEVMATRKGG